MTSHVYITINLFNLCQQSFFPFYMYLFKCWHRLNEAIGNADLKSEIYYLKKNKTKNNLKKYKNKSVNI